MILFNIRTDDSHASLIAAVNHGLDSEPGNPYLVRYGHVCGKRWWMAFDEGELPIVVLSGKVTHVGPRLEEWSNEVEDYIAFDANGQSVGYDRNGLWAETPIRVGDNITITRTVANLQTLYGQITYEIDIKFEWVTAMSELDHPGA